MSAAVSSSTSTGGLVLVRELDSVEQRLLYDRLGPEATDILLGMLRAAVLLSETVLLTDAMLLDGILFQVIGPADLAQALGLPAHRLPLLVLTRSGRLDDAVEAQRQDPTWSEVARRDRPGHDLARDVAERRTEWLRAAARDHFSVRPFGPGDFSLRFDDSDVFLSRLPKQVRAVATDLRREQGRRRAFTRLDQALAEHPDARGHVEAVRRWWNESYLRAIATQHGASWIRMATPARPEDVPPSAAPSRTLSGNLLETLRRIPPAVYGEILYASTAERARFRREGTQRALNGLAYAVRMSLPAAPRRSAVLRRAVLRLLLAGAAIGLSFAPSGWHFFGVTAALIALLLTTIPWDELWSIRDITRREHEATITLAHRS
ncbi:MAG: hypothetical protein ACTHJL_08845 [Amnibacterium sp.]